MLDCFHVDPPFSWNWNLEMLVFSVLVERKTTEPEEKPSERGERQQEIQPTYGRTGPESNPPDHIG